MYPVLSLSFFLEPSFFSRLLQRSRSIAERKTSSSATVEMDTSSESDNFNPQDFFVGPSNINASGTYGDPRSLLIQDRVYEEVNLLLLL